jgi:hypothetical protein
MAPSSSSENNSSSANHETPSILRNPKGSLLGSQEPAKYKHFFNFNVTREAKRHCKHEEREIPVYCAIFQTNYVKPYGDVGATNLVLVCSVQYASEIYYDLHWSLASDK